MFTLTCLLLDAISLFSGDISEKTYFTFIAIDLLVLLALLI